MAVSGVSSPAPRRGPLPALALAAVAVELLALRPVLFDRDGPIDDSQIMYGVIGCSFIAFGLVAWSRRPDSRVGMLMTAAGFGFFVAPVVVQFEGPVAFLVTVLLLDPWPFFFVALLLSLLTHGRLQSRFDRLLVASYAVPMWVVPLALLLFLDLDGLNPLVAFPNAGVADALLKAVWVAWIAVMGATVVVLVARWWAASWPRRRALLPTLAGGLALLLFAAMLVHDLFSETRSEVLMWIAHLTLLTVPAALLAGMLRSRLARGNLADLYCRLGTTAAADLQAARRRALGDPGAVLTLAGGPAPLPGPGQRVVPLERGGRRVAELAYDASLDEDPELVEAVAGAAAVAIENERLHAEAEPRLEELKASRERIVTAGDAERRRLERNLHDGAQQRLVAVALQLRLLQNRIGDDPAATELVTTASAELAESLADLRELARGMHRLCSSAGSPRRSTRWRAGRRFRRRCRARRASRCPMGRADRLLRRLRGARKRREVLARVTCHRAALAQRWAREHRDRGRRRRRRRRLPRLRPARSRRPCRSARRPAERRQPARARHLRHGGAAVRVVSG